MNNDIDIALKAYYGTIKEIYVASKDDFDTLAKSQSYWKRKIECELSALPCESVRTLLSRIEEKIVGQIETALAHYSREQTKDINDDQCSNLVHSLCASEAVHALVKHSLACNQNVSYEGNYLETASELFFLRDIESNRYRQPSIDVLKLDEAREQNKRAIIQRFSHASDGDLKKLEVSRYQYLNGQYEYDKETHRLVNKIKKLRQLSKDCVNSAMPITPSSKAISLIRAISKRREDQLEAHFTMGGFYPKSDKENPVEFAKRGPFLDLTRKLNEFVGPAEMGE